MSQTEAEREPRTNVRRSYERCLAARKQWRSIRGKTANEAIRDEAHGDLHEATMAWFETLVPYISQRPGEVRQLWESAPLYPLEPATAEALVCPGCEAGWYRDGDHDLELPHQCPVCEEYPLEPDEAVARNESGDVLYDWASGLKRLASWSDETKTKTVGGDKWRNETEEVEVPKRLDPDILLRAARYLDLAAEECGLLEDTDRALPTGEL